ncbi:hypothetical protein B0H14DRAFT_2421125, partial [Mycena olivaceomarginata]
MVLYSRHSKVWWNQFWSIKHTHWFCRLCPGRHMALSSLWITVVSILATFDITKAVDEKGNVVEPSYEYLSGV